MRAEILSTGEEIITGALTDTNATWLCRELFNAGISVSRQTCIGDSLNGISQTLKELSTRADLVLVTGGLGPTSDDLTAEAVAAASGDELRLNSRALLSVEAYFKKKGWPMSESNRKQACFPSGAGIMENSCGTAPGFYQDMGQTLFCFMPGVPQEMKVMFRLSVLPLIRKRFGRQPEILSEKLMVFGLGESAVNERIKGFNARFPKIGLGFRASFPVIEVKLFAEAGGPTGGNRTEMDTAKAYVIDKIGNKIFSREGLAMEAEVGRLLKKRGATVALAESCTGGLIATMMTDVPGSSDYFLFSGVTYANQAKTAVLGVKEKTLIQEGAVHEETAGQMAMGARRISGADFSIATSGIAGPDGGSEEKPVGTVCIAVAGPGFCKAETYRFSFATRAMNKKIFAVMALECLRRELI